MDRTVTYSTLKGTVGIPPSKSALHRQLIAAALSCRAAGASVHECLDNIVAPLRQSFELSDDIRTTISALQQIMDSTGVVDCRRSGTTLRLLIAVAAAIGGETVFKRDDQLKSRPITELLDQLRAHGVGIVEADDGIALKGRLSAGRYELPGNVSSQYISGLLFALPLLETDSEVIVNGRIESLPYVEMTIDTLTKAGVHIGHDDIYNHELTKHTLTVKGGQRYTYQQADTEGDWSLAAYWLTADSIMSGHCRDSRIEVVGLNPNSFQGDREILKLLERIRETSSDEVCEIDLTDIPDLGPILAVAAAAHHGTVRFVGARRLHYKESDRVISTIMMLRSLGGDTSEASYAADTFEIRGTGSLQGGTVDTYGDHRIAMAAAIAELICSGPVVILNSEVVDKSYPDFFDRLEDMM